MDDLEEWDFWDEPSVKTHSEIAKMFEELEELEHKFEESGMKTQEIETEIKECTDEIEEDTKDKIHVDEPAKKEKKGHLLKNIRKTKKPKIPKFVRERIHDTRKIKKPRDIAIKKQDNKFTKRLKQRITNYQSRMNLGELWAEQKKYTFLITINEDGTLTGFPKVTEKEKKKDKRGFFSRKKEEQTSSEDVQQDIKVKGLKGLFKRILPKSGKNKEKKSGFINKLIKRKKTKESAE
ncbi:MAG: hypothetical protein QXS02_05185 [Candidatus Thermoplasmatota archaeon]